MKKKYIQAKKVEVGDIIGGRTVVTVSRPKLVTTPSGDPMVRLVFDDTSDNPFFAYPSHTFEVERPDPEYPVGTVARGLSSGKYYFRMTEGWKQDGFMPVLDEEEFSNRHTSIVYQPGGAR